jgi:hypothetical protein
MPDQRGSRFAFEALFLIALAVGLAFARLDPLEIAGLMLLGWLIVAALEWAAWRDEPHYGSGLPPRYYVPRVSLPPAQPLEQVRVGYPEAQRDEAPTWIASASLRAEVLGEWPIATPARRDDEPAPDVEEAEHAEDAAVEDDRWTRAELPAAPLGEETESEPVVASVALPEEPEPEPEPEPESVPAAAAAPEDEPDADTDGDLKPAPAVLVARAAGGVARYSLDPLAEPPPKRRFGRGADVTVPTVEVPARPNGGRPLPPRRSAED